MKPNFNNCILNVTSAIMAKYHIESKYEVNNLIYDQIKDKKHVFLVVLDGLGKNLVEQHLDQNSFVIKNSIDYITSVFPPTTVAATTSLLSGKAPGETGWLGWHQYFDDFKQDIVLFKNVNFYTGERLTINVANTYLGYNPFYYSFKNVECRELYPNFKENGFNKFSKMIEEMVKISNKQNETYTYCYWNQPDYEIHEFGTKHHIVKKVIKKLDQELNKFMKKCGESTAVIVLADHGLVDTKNLYLKDYPDFLECLVRKPSIESRTLAFKVNNHEKFLELFDKYFGKYFALYDRKTFLESGYLGPDAKKAIPFLGDYIAIATDNYCIAYEKQDPIFKASHAGGTADEMIVPLVIATK